MHTLYMCMNAEFPAEAGFNKSVIKAMVGVVIQGMSAENANQIDQA